MKLLFVCVLVLLWLVAVTASGRDSRGHRGRQECDYNMKRYISNLRKCLADERAETDKLKEEIEDARAENNKLKVQIDDARTESDKLKEEIEDARAENNKLKEQIDDARRESDKSKEEIEDERAEKESLKEEIEEISKCCVRYDGLCHEEGTTFSTTDGCHSCTCSNDSLVCTPILGACPAECTYNGQTYTAGDLFAAEEECGWCTCGDDGNVNCMSSPSCIDVAGYDCKDILQKNVNATDGPYYVQLETGEIIQVYCDMSGGWTVFQKRYDGSLDFYKNFDEYETGFGSITGEFWLGLRHIYQMTNGLTNELRLDLEKSTGETGYAVYQSFSLSEPSMYSLNIGVYSGTAGDAGSGLSYQKGTGFSTYDRDVDPSTRNCAVEDHGGWWYNLCAYVNLNGEYVTPGTESSYNGGEGGVIHSSFDGYKSLKSTEMKFRRT